MKRALLLVSLLAIGCARRESPAVVDCTLSLSAPDEPDL